MRIHELLAINNHLIGDRTVQAVDARALHQALGVGRDFSTWVRSKVTSCGLIEGVHWAKITLPESGDGTFAPIEYTLTLDAAKLIAMSSRGEPARLVREYFLECERYVQHHTELALPGSREAAISEWSSISRSYATVAESLGYSQAEARRSSLVIGYQIQQQTGFDVLPPFLLEDSEANAARALVLDPTAGVTAALVSKGINGLNVTQIAKSYPELTVTMVNKVLVSLGFQTQISKSTFSPTAISEEFAVTATIASGPNAGKRRVTAWNWADVRFRSVVDAQLTSASIAVAESKATTLGAPSHPARIK